MTCRARCTRGHSEQVARKEAHVAQEHMQSNVRKRTCRTSSVRANAEQVARERVKSKKHEKICAEHCTREHAQQVARENARSKLISGNSRSKLHEQTGEKLGRDSLHEKPGPKLKSIF